MTTRGTHRPRTLGRRELRAPDTVTALSYAKWSTPDQALADRHLQRRPRRSCSSCFDTGRWLEMLLAKA
jgi:hypothetical protein